jgi:hypothetical protein
VFSSRQPAATITIKHAPCCDGYVMAHERKAKTTIAQPKAIVEASGEKASTGPMTVIVHRLRLHDPDTLRFVAEFSVSPGDLVISGENRGHRAADGRIDGIMAGFVTTRLDGVAQELAFTTKGSTWGFEARCKGNPGKRDRDIALVMAVGFEERNHRMAGTPMTLTAIFEMLSTDENWHLAEADVLRKAYLRGKKLLKAVCFAVLARAPQSDDDATAVGAVALVKERSEFNFQSAGNWSYIGFPWLWRRGRYTIEHTDLVCPLKLTSVNGECSYDKSGIKVKDS